MKYPFLLCFRKQIVYFSYILYQKKRGCLEIGSHAFSIQLLSLFLLYSLTFHAFCKIIFADRYFEFFNDVGVKRSFAPN